MDSNEILRLIFEYPHNFALGVEEAGASFGQTFDDDPESDASLAYDLGRTLGEAYL